MLKKDVAVQFVALIKWCVATIDAVGVLRVII